MATRVDNLGRELKLLNKQGGYHGSLICTDQGLLIASDGNLGSDEALAGFTSLFDDIVIRARRDLGRDSIDEITLLDRARGRLVIRPIVSDGADRLMLVVSLPADASWRRNTTALTRRLRPLLEGRLGASPDKED